MSFAVDREAVRLSVSACAMFTQLDALLFTTFIIYKPRHLPSIARELNADRFKFGRLGQEKCAPEHIARVSLRNALPMREASGSALICTTPAYGLFFTVSFALRIESPSSRDSLSQTTIPFGFRCLDSPSCGFNSVFKVAGFRQGCSQRIDRTRRNI